MTPLEPRPRRVPPALADGLVLAFGAVFVLGVLLGAALWGWIA